MNRDELTGKAKALGGRVKQSVGRATNNPRLENEGIGDEAAGKTRATIGKARRKVGEAVEKVGKTIKK